MLRRFGTPKFNGFAALSRDHPSGTTHAARKRASRPTRSSVQRVVFRYPTRSSLASMGCGASVRLADKPATGDTAPSGLGAGTRRRRAVTPISTAHRADAAPCRPPKLVRVVVAGGPGTGKSTFARRCVGGNFPPSARPFVSGPCALVVDGRELDLQVRLPVTAVLQIRVLPPPGVLQSRVLPPPVVLQSRVLPPPQCTGR